VCVWSCLWCQDHAGICCMLTLKTACQKWRLLTFSEMFYRRSIIYTTEALFTGKYAVGESWVIYQCRSWITVIAIAVIARIGEPFKGSNVPFMSHFVNELMIMKAVCHCIGHLSTLNIMGTTRHWGTLWKLALSQYLCPDVWDIVIIMMSLSLTACVQ